MAASNCISTSAAKRTLIANRIEHESRAAIRKQSGLRKDSAIEPVPQTSQVAQILRIRRIRLDLLPKVGNVIVHHSIGGERVRGPCAIQQAIAAQHPPARANEQREQLELNGRQFDGLPIAAQFAALEVHFHVAETIALGRLFGGAAAQQGFDAGAELARAERFGNVAVGSQFQAHHLLGFLSLGGQHENWSAQTVAPQFAANLETIFARQHDIEQDQVKYALTRAARGGISVRDHLDLVALHLEVVLKPQGDRRFVFNHQNPRHARPTKGSSIVKALPSPGLLATVIAPPCAAAMWRTIASPTPEPFAFVALAAVPRTNFRKIAFFSESGMPGPLSRTSMARNSLRTPHSTHTVGHSGEYFTALSSRLRRATEIASGSPSTRHRASDPASSIWRP